MQSEPINLEEVDSVDPYQQLMHAVDEGQSLLHDLEDACAEMGQLQGSVSAATAALQQELIIRALAGAVGRIERCTNRLFDRQIEVESAIGRLKAQYQAELRQEAERWHREHARKQEVEDRARRLQSELQIACHWVGMLSTNDAALPEHRAEMITAARLATEHFSV